MTTQTACGIEIEPTDRHSIYVCPKDGSIIVTIVSDTTKRGKYTTLSRMDAMRVAFSIAVAAIFQIEIGLQP